MAMIELATVNGKARILADIYGVRFGLHQVLLACNSDIDRVELSTDAFAVTHIGSGMAMVTGLSYEEAKKAAERCASSELDWTLSNGSASLTDAHRVFGKQLRAQFEGR